MKSRGLHKLNLLWFEWKILRFVSSYAPDLWRVGVIRQLRYSATNLQRRGKVVDIQRYAKVVDIRRRASAIKTRTPVIATDTRYIDIMLSPRVKLYYHPAEQNLYLLDDKYIVLHEGPRVSPWEWRFYRLCCILLVRWRNFRRR